MNIGHYQLEGQVILAPMAGVADQPFRNLCREFDVALAVSEMVSVKPALRQTRKSIWRHSHEGEKGLCSVQIVGTEAAEMAMGAQYNVAHGADIIDINMGCPARKVCKKAAGSALMRDERRVAEILQSVVHAVDVPVTLKIRTGWGPDERNAVSIAKIAQDSGIQALAVHGRTRACAFKGEAEYDTIAAVKQAVDMPVIANGDIDSSKKALQVLEYTGADAVMVGRAAQGNPWLIRDMQHFLSCKERLPAPDMQEVLSVMKCHLTDMLAFYGEAAGVRIARKHLGRYCDLLPFGQQLKPLLNQAEMAAEQMMILDKCDKNINDLVGLAA